MKHLIIVLILVTVGCRSSTETVLNLPGDDPVMTHAYFPYFTGDTYAWGMSFGGSTTIQDTHFYTVGAPQQFDGQSYFPHVRAAIRHSHQQDSLTPSKTTYYRVEGEKVYRWIDGAKRLFTDFGTRFVETSEATPLLFVNDDVNLKSGGREHRSRMMQAGTSSEVDLSFHVKDLGIILLNGSESYYLIRSTIGGKNYP